MKKILENKNIIMIVLGVIAGIILIIFGSIKNADNSDIEETLESKYSSEELESYTASLETKVKEHIERIGGVSNVNVIITIDGSNETVYATDGGSKDYVIIKDNSGNESALSLMEINATVRGIAVVCDYGHDEVLKQQIIEMLASLFNIGTNRISVMSS